MMKRLALAALMACAITVSDARAEMPQTDVEMIEQMGVVDGDKVLQALEVFYELAASELEVQYANEQVTEAFFDARRAARANASADDVAKLEKIQMDRREQRDASVKANAELRKRLEGLSGIVFLDNLTVTPDAPMSAPKTAPSGAPADLVTARSAAWETLSTAGKALDEERLVLLDAQERYYKGDKVPIGDHLRAMTAAELAYTKAVTAYRLLEAKIAVATGGDVAAVLGGL